jgi:hypothetical protein
MPIAVQWWAVGIPAPSRAAAPRGAAHARFENRGRPRAVLFFNVAHYVLRPWPWILVGLASLIVTTLADLARAVPHVDPRLIGHDLPIR